MRVHRVRSAPLRSPLNREPLGDAITNMEDGQPLRVMYRDIYDTEAWEKKA
jgi:hypothetical protein